MAKKEKLIELLDNMIHGEYHKWQIEAFADYLIANGVNVQEHGR